MSGLLFCLFLFFAQGDIGRVVWRSEIGAKGPRGPGHVWRACTGVSLLGIGCSGRARPAQRAAIAGLHRATVSTADTFVPGGVSSEREGAEVSERVLRQQQVSGVPSSFSACLLREGSLQALRSNGGIRQIGPGVHVDAAILFCLVLLLPSARLLNGGAW